MLINKNRQELYRSLFEEYGELQLIVAIEELAELQKALTKHLRGKQDFGNIVEELADVEIVLEQLNQYFDCDLLVARKIADKLERTKDRMDRCEL